MPDTHPDGLVEFEAGGERYTAVFGFKAMKLVEQHYDEPFFRAILNAMPKLESESDLSDPAKVSAAAADIRFGDVGKLFEFALRRHHPDLTEDQIDDIADEIGIGKVAEVVGQAFTAALVKEGDGGSSPRPPKPRANRTR